MDGHQQRRAKGPYLVTCRTRHFTISGKTGTRQQNSEWRKQRRERERESVSKFSESNGPRLHGSCFRRFQPWPNDSRRCPLHYGGSYLPLSELGETVHSSVVAELHTQYCPHHTLSNERKRWHLARGFNSFGLRLTREHKVRTFYPALAVADDVGHAVGGACLVTQPHTTDPGQSGSSSVDIRTVTTASRRRSAT